MGCKTVRGETIYFVRHTGAEARAGELHHEWYTDDVDALLLPGVFARHGGHPPASLPSVVPIEIRTFEAS